MLQWYVFNDYVNTMKHLGIISPLTWDNEQLNAFNVCFGETPKDVVESYAMRGDFLRNMRDDVGRNFFVGLQDHEPTSTKAIEANYRFLLETTATFATEPMVPHGVWKAACVRSFVASTTKPLELFLDCNSLGGCVGQIGGEIWHFSVEDKKEGDSCSLAAVFTNLDVRV